VGGIRVIELPSHGQYRCILADPPWHFRARTELQRSNWVSRRDAEKHFQVMGIDDIKALPVRDLAAKDAHLFLWATGPCLRMAFDVIEAWGFRYSAVAFTWVKLKRSVNAAQLRFVPTAESDLHVGLGLTTRKNAEFCLLGRRGNAHRNAKDVREIIMAPVREHSRKPDEAAARIERYCDGPYVELFARQSRPGWDNWGNEVSKFDGERPKRRRETSERAIELHRTGSPATDIAERAAAAD
jgi:N6-adenosine-specific RNA methylase IME4